MKRHCLAPHDINEQGEQNTQHDHRRDRDKNSAALGLNIDIAGQSPEPGEQPGRDVQECPDGNQ